MNVKALKRPTLQTAFVEAVNREFQVCDTDSVNSGNISDNLKTNLIKIAEKILPVTQKAKLNEVWREDGTFNQLINERARCDKATDRHKELTRNIKKRVRYLKNQKLREEADEINLCAQKTGSGTLVSLL